ncbi:hypothetical protein HMPREF2618_13780 [Staphylococcus sp. HMSC035F11]|nr:hypothetical protein HMPREF2618_13780 [Staphylococcus sp. HMSC035F11]
MGPQHREFRKEILQAMQVGVWAPTQRNWISNFYRQCKLGWDDEINFAKISFLSHSLMHEFYSCNFIFKDILHLANV